MSAEPLFFPGGVVAVEDDVVFIHALRENDADVVRVVAAAPDPVAAVRSTLALGARVLRLANESLDAQLVERQFEKMTSDLDASLAAFSTRVEQVATELLGVGDDDRGALYRLLGRWRVDVQGYLDRVFSDDGSKASALTKLDAVLERAGRAQTLELRRLIDPDNELSPLRRWRDEIVAALERRGQGFERAVAELAREIAVGRAPAAAHQRTAVKGTDFEERLEPVLKLVASPRGDLVEHVAKTPGVAGSEVGDFVVALNPAEVRGRAARYVVEAKDRKRMSTRAALDELGRAIANRAALAGMIVFTDDTCPEPEPITLLEDDKVIVAVDRDDPDELTLRLACAIARWTAARRALGTDSAALDLDRVQGLLEMARRALKRATTVKAHLGKARKGIADAGDALVELIENAAAALDELERTFDESTSGESPHV